MVLSDPKQRLVSGEANKKKYGVYGIGRNGWNVMCGGAWLLSFWKIGGMDHECLRED